MAKIKQIAEYLESIAPKAFQESYDNSGLIVGNPEAEISRILICLDSTEDVIDEAVKKGCNLVIAHLPLIFRGLKKLTPDTYVERTVVKAIKNDVAIYALHTNLDNVSEGVNKKIGEKIGLKNLRILSPRNQVERKLVVFVPEEDTRRVLDAMHEAGAGVIGNYTRCSFRTGGIGSFEPGDEANPHIGQHNKLEEAPENRVEVIFPAYLESRVLAAMKQAHPYEEAAYFLHRLENRHNSVGAGMIGGTLAHVAAREALGDVILFDIDVPWVLDRSTLKSRCSNSPFDEARLSGRVLRTIVAGRTVYEYV